MSRQKTTVNPLTIIIIIISLFLISGLVQNALGLYGSRQRLETTEAEVKDLEKQQQDEELQVAAQTDPAALDQAIHNKLNLTKPDETVVIIAGTHQMDDQNDVPENVTNRENSPLDQWLHLFNL